MAKNIYRRFVQGVCLLCLPAALAAGPKLVVDTVNYNAGTVAEESVTFIRHTFTIRNEGDSVLRFLKIKAKCGCTSVKNDSLIPPDSAGHITMELDLREVKDINFYKYIAVRTNDRRWPRLELAISGTLTACIHVAPEAIVLPTMEKKDTVQEITLTTAKSDLQVSNVFFAIEKPAVEWMGHVPLRFAFDKNGKKNAAGLSAYKLKIFYTPVGRESSGYGKFIVQTNHPEKAEVTISGVLDEKKQP